MINTPCYSECASFAAYAWFFNEETFDLGASHLIHRKSESTSLALIETLLCTSLKEQKS